MPSEAPELPPTTGLIAGKYQLSRLIGRGGMGSVWEGRHTSLGTRVAVKFIDAEFVDSQEARTRFDNEARVAATIQSKHAIQIYDHGVTDDGKPYIVMELLHGEPLDQRIERLGRLSLQETARILRQVARALQRAHERGIVHRDLKPENIFLVRTPDDDDEVAKVLDFGIAKFRRPDHLTAPGGLSSSTKTGAVLGTPFFMSPEQARGLREIDHRTDLWSLGIIAYKCVAGVLPFDGVSVGDLLVKICTSPPPIPSMVIPGLPIAFDAWFARALEKEPNKRFQSAQELADALAYAAGVSVRKQGGYGVVDGQAATVAANGRYTSSPPAVRASSADGSGSERAFIGGQTSSPFTASTPRAQGSSRSVMVTAISAALVGVAIGVFAILKMGSALKHTPPPAPSTVLTQPSGAPAIAPAPSSLPALQTGEKPGHVEATLGASAAAAPDASAPEIELPATPASRADKHGRGKRPGAPATTATGPGPAAPSTAAPTASATPQGPPPSQPAVQPAPLPSGPPAAPPPTKPPVSDPGY